jgi:ribose/xylose/arabinose/galactoside ABC-type transport system permease subunit
MGKENRQPFHLTELLRKYVIILVFIVCIAVFGLLNPKFFSMTNILNLLWQNSYLVVVSVGMAILLIGGGVDLAAGYEMSIGGVVAAASLVWWHFPIWLSILLALAVVMGLSLVNGYITVKFKLNALMVTLGTMTVYSGISNIFTDQKAIFNLPDAFKYIGQGTVFGVVPLAAVIMAILVAAASFILNKTYFGRYIYAVGGNPEAANLAGIKVKKVKLAVFALAGFFFGMGAILLVSRTGSANASMASGTEFTAITAAVLGGVAIQGGEGKLWSVVVGTFILGILANGMQIIGLGVYAQYIAKGTILIAAMSFDMYQKSKAARSVLAA